MYFLYHSACVSAFWGSLFGNNPMKDLVGIIWGPTSVDLRPLVPESYSVDQFSATPSGVLIILSKVVQFQYKKQQNSTKQVVNYYWSSKVSSCKLFCHTFSWNVKTVISSKTCDCNKIKQNVEKYDFQCQSFMAIFQN